MDEEKRLRKGLKVFWFLVIFDVAIAITDGILTYIATPDLALEGNPLVAHFGLGWGALFIANIIGIGVHVAATYYAFVKYKRPLVECRTSKEFISSLFFNRPDKFIWTLYRLPKNWKPFFALCGYTIGITLPISRIFTVLPWVLYLTDSPFRYSYRRFRSLFPGSRFDIFFAVVLAIVLIAYWLIKEYRINKNCINSAKQGATENALQA